MQTSVKFNDTRGCSYVFGYELCKSFMKPNKIISVIRAHEAQSNGYKMYHWGGKKQFPTVITIFSAPNYCDFYNNKAAVIRLMVRNYPIIGQHSRYSTVFGKSSSIFLTKFSRSL